LSDTPALFSKVSIELQAAGDTLVEGVDGVGGYVGAVALVGGGALAGAVVVDFAVQPAWLPR